MDVPNRGRKSTGDEKLLINFRQTSSGFNNGFQDPRTMEIEHAELHAKLRKGTAEKGSIKKAAKRLVSVMHPHFVKKEDFALPPLGLLPSLSKGKVTQDMKGILLMTDKLKVQLNQMLKEHEEILTALEKLTASAKKENKLEYLRFAERLTLYAQTEEDLLSCRHASR
jgi:hypothetical protein